MVVRELKRSGYDVNFQQVDNRDALTASLAARKWDLVISDFSMPRFSGIDALKLIRSEGCDTPFIFVSGAMGEETAVAALKDGAQDYIIKTNMKRLVPAVQRELREVEDRRERKRLELHVVQLQKFEAIGKLAGGIAHDFNNVLGAIMGWAEMGAEKTLADTSAHSTFQKIGDQAQRAGGLTRQLLAYARRQILEPRNINLNEIVADTTSLLQKIIGVQIEVKLVLAPDLRVTRADPTQIEQIVMNLCLNARDAMSQAGQLLIETQNIEMDEEYCRHHVYAHPGQYVLLSVSDTGTGMDAATLEHIFEPFFTTKEMGRGTGLGLATVYGVVKQHDGFISVYSELGQGTTFRVYLPVSSGVAELREKPKEGPVRGGTETILVADDNEALREMAQETLEGLGYHVMLASDGEEAVRLFEANRDHIASVVLDVSMPKLSGPEAYLRINEIKGGVPAVFTTGYSAEADVLHPLAENGAVVLQKPYSPKVLGQKVREVL